MASRSGRRLAAVLAALLVAAAAFAFWPRPVIRAVQPIAAAPGEAVEIRGERFGEAGPDALVLLDGSGLTARSIRSWSPDRIEMIMPSTVDSGFLRVRTRFGTSAPEGIIAMKAVPASPARGEAARTGPSISGITPPQAGIGDLITLQGLNFGQPGGDSAVLFTRADGSGAPGAEQLPELRGHIRHWEDSAVTVRVPSGSGSGSVTLRGAQGGIARAYLDIHHTKGSTRLGEPATWAITQRVVLRSIRTGGDNQVFLWVPELPVTASQLPLRELEASAAPWGASVSPSAYQAPRPGAGIAAAYRFTGVADRSELVFTRSWLVLVRQVETFIAPQGSFPAPSGDMEFLAPALADDPDVPSARKEVRELAARIVGAERDQRRKALRIWDWAVRRLAWQPGRVSDPLVAIRTGKADSRTYAMACTALLRAAGVPALPVSGVLAKKDGTLVPHFWVEYYLMGMGWIPFDAALGSGALPGGFDAALVPAARYHGALDDRHVAVASGYARIDPLLAGAPRRAVRAAWGMQSMYEESTGVNSRESVWEAPEITRVY